MARSAPSTMNGNPIWGISLVASTVPCVAHCPVLVSTSADMAPSLPESDFPRSAAERHPAESPEGDDQAAQAPRRDDEQVRPGKAGPRGVRVVGGQQRRGQV